MSAPHALNYSKAGGTLRTRLGTRRASGKSSVLFTAGTSQSGQTSRLVTVMLVAVDVPPDALEAAARYMHTIQVVAQRLRILLFTDSTALGITRRYGWMVEHVMGEADYAVLNPAEQWTDMVEERAHSTMDALDVELLVHCDDLGVDGAQHRMLMEALKMGDLRYDSIDVASPYPYTPRETWHSWPALTEALKVGAQTQTIERSGGHAEFEIVGGKLPGPVVVVEEEQGPTALPSQIRSVFVRQGDNQLNPNETSLGMRRVIDDLAPDRGGLVCSPEYPLALTGPHVWRAVVRPSGEVTVAYLGGGPGGTRMVSRVFPTLAEAVDALDEQCAYHRTGEIE